MPVSVQVGNYYFKSAAIAYYLSVAVVNGKYYIDVVLHSYYGGGLGASGGYTKYRIQFADATARNTALTTLSALVYDTIVNTRDGDYFIQPVTYESFVAAPPVSGQYYQINLNLYLFQSFTATAVLGLSQPLILKFDLQADYDNAVTALAGYINV